MKKILLACLLLITLILPMGVGAADFYAVKRTNITTSSVNIEFGFPAKILIIHADSSNGAEVCINWKGDPAVCPAADTAGADRLPAGNAITLDNYGISEISVIAASGTQIIYVRAWR